MKDIKEIIKEMVDKGYYPGKYFFANTKHEDKNPYFRMMKKKSNKELVIQPTLL